MRITNKILNYKIHWTSNGLIKSDVKTLLENVLNSTANVNYTFEINTTAVTNAFNVKISLEFTGLNFYNFFRESNKITAKIAKLLSQDSFIETIFTNNL